MDIEKLSKECGLKPVAYTDPMNILSYKNTYTVTEDKTKTNTVDLWTGDQLDEIFKKYQTLRAKLASADVLVEALRRFVDDSISVDFGEGDYVGTTYESLEIAKQTLSTYDKLSEVKHDTE